MKLTTPWAILIAGAMIAGAIATGAIASTLRGPRYALGSSGGGTVRLDMKTGDLQLCHPGNRTGCDITFE